MHICATCLLTCRGAPCAPNTMSWRFGKSKHSGLREGREGTGLSSMFNVPNLRLSISSSSATPTPYSRPSSAPPSEPPSEPATPTLGSPNPSGVDAGEQQYTSSTTRPGVLSITVFEGRDLELPDSLTVLSSASGHMALPYVVLQFDKNEVLILGAGGSISTPRWCSTANL